MFYFMLFTGFITFFYPFCLLVRFWITWTLREESNENTKKRLKYRTQQEQVRYSDMYEANRLVDIVISQAFPIPPSIVPCLTQNTTSSKYLTCDSLGFSHDTNRNGIKALELSNGSTNLNQGSYNSYFQARRSRRFKALRNK
ncbi:hypothetical protein F4811DRAFT_88470 [Daldinia bambusicola]|nr:hypothetical protein F4811DRAFT_88470 [Daldinia bambusicola]